MANEEVASTFAAIVTEGGLVADKAVGALKRVGLSYMQVGLMSPLISAVTIVQGIVRI